MEAMVNNIIDGSRPGSLILGLTVFIVPAIMFFVHGIRDRRPIMFAVHALIIAFWGYFLAECSKDVAKAAKAAFSDTGSIITFVLTAVASFFFWLFLIRRFFGNRN